MYRAIVINGTFSACLMIDIEHIKWGDREAVVAMGFACVGIIATLWVALVFVRHNNTTVVKVRLSKHTCDSISCIASSATINIYHTCSTHRMTKTADFFNLCVIPSSAPALV